MNPRRGRGQRLGSPASFTAHVHARAKEAARMARLARVQSCRPLKVLLPATERPSSIERRRV